MRRAYADYWDTLLQQARNDGELRSDANLGVIRLFLIGALNWTVEWYQPRRGAFKQFAAQITDIVFDGISSRDDSQLWRNVIHGEPRLERS